MFSPEDSFYLSNFGREGSQTFVTESEETSFPEVPLLKEGAGAAGRVPEEAGIFSTAFFPYQHLPWSVTQGAT